MWHPLGGRTLSKPRQSNLDSPQPQEAWRSRHIWNWMVSYLFQNELEFSSICSPESVSGQIKQNWTCLKLLKTLRLRGNQWNVSVEVWNFDWMRSWKKKELAMALLIFHFKRVCPGFETSAILLFAFPSVLSELWCRFLFLLQLLFAHLPVWLFQLWRLSVPWPWW